MASNTPQAPDLVIIRVSKCDLRRNWISFRAPAADTEFPGAVPRRNARHDDKPVVRPSVTIIFLPWTESRQATVLTDRGNESTGLNALSFGTGAFAAFAKDQLVEDMNVLDRRCLTQLVHSPLTFIAVFRHYGGGVGGRLRESRLTPHLGKYPPRCCSRNRRAGNSIFRRGWAAAPT